MDQDKKLLKIYNHFGRDAQLEKLREEVEEFIEAVKSGNKEHAAEEAGDILTVLVGAVNGEELSTDIVIGTIGVKADRTLERMESGYYENKKKETVRAIPALEFEYPKSMSLEGGVDEYRIGTNRYGKGDCRGRKVIFKGEGGYASELERAMNTFEVGQVLTVREIYVGRSSSVVEFEGIDGRWNTVMFDDVEIE